MRMDWIQLLSKFFDWLLTVEDWRSLEGFTGRVLILLVTFALVLLALKYLLELILTVREKSIALGFLTYLSREQRSELRRRQQFCGALVADLAALAKTENWNDQFFTDLEAQIEAEGRFYATHLQRLLRRPSRGLRRVPSLIKAIDSSAEDHLLLIGEPGSGKSVALRHLAHRYALRAQRSRSPDAKIPLYINLKELPPPPATGLNVAFVKQFVLDNVRRGDADTAAYVREHWDLYKEEGRWFFLFDSFDEIPAILHAPSGSATIADHAEVLRQFATSMSGCRAVLASREFKGPRTLPWQSFRILPLSQARRDELVGNAFLTSGQQRIVIAHLAAGDSQLFHNPLFLTLLCRFVKEEGHPPQNDLDLLGRHIERLAARDSEYVWRRYMVSAGALVNGSIRLARLFAEGEQLSLAPTLDEIRAAVGVDDALGDIENFLSALVYVKICRSDVPEARGGDRRFTFSHRRYQEALFVRHLALHPDYLPPRELLTNLRWREYAVTLLQSQPRNVIEPLLEEATIFLRDAAGFPQRTRILESYGVDLFYYEWDMDSAQHLLLVLTEGLARRPADIPPSLRQAAGLFLMPRWRDGDLIDQTLVLRVAGLLPDDDLQNVLQHAIRNGTDAMLRHVVQQAVFLRETSTELSSWIRSRLSDEIVTSRGSSALLKVEALGARLPASVGFRGMFRRSCLLRRFYRPFASESFALIIAQFFLVFAVSATADWATGNKIGVVGKFLAGGAVIYALLFVWLHGVRNLGEQFALREVAVNIARRSDNVFLVAAVVSLSLGWVMLEGAGRQRDIASIFGIVITCCALVVAMVPIAAMFRGRRARRRLRDLISEWKCTGALALHARSAEELTEWLKANFVGVCPSTEHRRSLAAVLLHSGAAHRLPCGHFSFDRTKLKERGIKAVARLLGQVDEAEGAARGIEERV